ncbi:MAG TPA: PilZ domain-containing protein [Bdellovibrionales bacterium]|nr:PilZ domain-containing protein [Bdellovibrionales bacterium]
MNKVNVFIASRTEQENYILQKKLEPLEHEFKGLSFSGVHPAGLPLSVDSRTAVVIYNFNEWSSREASNLDELKKAGYRGQILIIAKADVTKAMQVVGNAQGLVFLQKPFAHKDLVGLLRKMLTTRQISQQVHKRFPTAQDAVVEILGQGGNVNSRVRNLSKGGACLEFLSQAPVAVGEKVVVNLSLADMKRTYQMPARVVWTTRGGRGGGVGVEFTGPGEMKIQILGA